uniref:FAD-dependent oxidoreductase n=1 Tax=Saccharibacillus sp. CPCC 101409 TaxID=3058041 RepID=UPI0034A003B8
MYTFVFDKDKDLSWKAGQYGLFSIKHKKIKKGTKPFSLSSAPAEDAVRITTKIAGEPSEFKQALLEMERGTKIGMSGPLGPFYLKDRGPALFVAGGMGITPFRSIIKQLHLTGTGAGMSVRLLYLDGEKSYIYRSELGEKAGDSPISVSYLASRDELYGEIDEYAALHEDGKYFVAGPRSLVDAVSVYLQTKKVPKRNIAKDAFFGY